MDKKMLIRILALVMAAILGLGCFLLPAMAAGDIQESGGSMSIGIIGGADGPTAIFVTGSVMPLIVGAAVILLAVAALVVFKKRKK